MNPGWASPTAFGTGPFSLGELGSLEDTGSHVGSFPSLWYNCLAEKKWSLLWDSSDPYNSHIFFLSNGPMGWITTKCSALPSTVKSVIWLPTLLVTMGFPGGLRRLSPVLLSPYNFLFLPIQWDQHLEPRRQFPWSIGVTFFVSFLGHLFPNAIFFYTRPIDSIQSFGPSLVPGFFPNHVHTLALLNFCGFFPMNVTANRFAPGQPPILPCHSMVRLSSHSKSLVTFTLAQPPSICNFHLMSPWFSPTKALFTMRWFSAASGLNRV